MIAARALGRGLVAATVAVLLAGCASAPQPLPTATQDAALERGPIMLAVPDVNATAWIQTLRVWNLAHPDQAVTVRVYPADPTTRHDQLAAAAAAKNGESTIVALDSAWLPEFASQGWIKQLDAASFATEGVLPTAVGAGTYSGASYGAPVTVDAGLLYYRKDVLSQARVKVPTTWGELTAACDKAQPQQPRGLSCYGTGLRAGESLMVNLTEAIDAAGGSVLTPAGVPGFDSAKTAAGIDALAAAGADGTITADALGWDDAEAQQAFLDGKLVFLRGGAATWAAAQANDGSSRVNGRVGVAALVNPAGAAVPAANGLQLTLSPFGRNQATAVDVMRWLGGEEAQQELMRTGGFGPVITAMYAKPQAKQMPSLAVLAAVAQTARPAVSTVHYAEFSQVVSSTLQPVIAGKDDADKVLPGLQSKLVEVLK